MAPETTASPPVRYTYNFSPDANEVLYNASLTPATTMIAVHQLLNKLSYGPTPTFDDEIKPLIPGDTQLFKYKVDNKYVLHYKVIEEHKNIIVIGISRFN